MPYAIPPQVSGDAIAAALRAAPAGSYEKHVNMWLLTQTPLPDDELRRYWTLWALITFASAFTSAFVVVLILARKKLREVSYNHLIVGLALPDLFFSFCCGITCALHVLVGHWYDGEGVFGGGWMCDFQAFYSVYGTAGSMWVNILITFELESISRSMGSGRRYVRPTTAQTYQRLACVYAFVFAVSWSVSFGYRFWPELAAQPGSIRGLYCLPVDYDMASLRFKYGVTLSVLLYVPLLIVVGLVLKIKLHSALGRGEAEPAVGKTSTPRHSFRGSHRHGASQHKLQRAGGSSHRSTGAGASTPRASRHLEESPALSGAMHDGSLSPRTVASFAAEMNGLPTPPPLSSSSAMEEGRVGVGSPPLPPSGGGDAPSAMPRSMRYALDIQASAMRAIHIFFARLLFVMLVMWGPFLLSWSYTVPYYRAGGQVTWITGSMAHLQGLLSACIYLTKEDLWAELRAVGAEARAALDCRRRGGAAAAAPPHEAPGGPGSPNSTTAAARWGSAVGDEMTGSRAMAERLESMAAPAAQQPSALDNAAVETGLSEEMHSEMQELANAAEQHVSSFEQMPMLVVAWSAWLALSAIPHSSLGVTRRVRETDTIIFISHRWWLAQDGTPDDAHDTKFQLIKLGVQRLIDSHGLDPACVAVWIDYASVDQDDAELQAKGIASLIAYAARSHFVFIPVEPTLECMLALSEATHPIELLNYGERAWCRLEIYVVLCLAEMMRRDVAVYAYGNMHLGERAEGARVGLDALPPTIAAIRRRRGGGYAQMPDGSSGSIGHDSVEQLASIASPSEPDAPRERDEQPLLPSSSTTELDCGAGGAGAGGRVGCWSRCARALHKLIRSGTMSHEQLRPLLSTYGVTQRGTAGAALQHGAHFVRNEMPSSGELTYEADRAQIVQVETEIRRWYVDHAILAAKLRFRAQKGAERTYELRSKQVGSQQTYLLSRALLSDPDLSKLNKLDLAGNLFGHLGVQGLRPLLCSPAASSLTALNLSRNSHLRVKGMAALADVLALSRCRIASLELVDCALTPAAGIALSRGLSASRRLRHLDISHNLCDDLAVTTMIDAVRGANRRFSTTTSLVVEGNPLSDGVMQVVGLLHLMATGIMADAMPAMPDLEHAHAPELEDEDEDEDEVYADADADGGGGGGGSFCASAPRASEHGRNGDDADPARPRILLITDPGPDPDDVKVLLVLAVLHHRGLIEFVGAIANGGGQPALRARLARCFLDTVGAHEVPVAIGSMGQPYSAQPHEYAIDGFDAVDEARLLDGAALIATALAESPDGSLTVLVISALTDLAEAIRADGALARARLACVSVMGGLEVDDAAPYGWAPDTSVNNSFDTEAARFVYDWCFEQGVPMAVVSRNVVPMLPMQLAHSFAVRTACPVMRYLADAQYLGLEGLWQKLCEGALPARCDKRWFAETFCQGLSTHVIEQLDHDAPIRPHLNGFVKPYDVLALMAALPQTRHLFADAARTRVAAADGRSVTHLLLLDVAHVLEVRHVERLLRDAYRAVVMNETTRQRDLAESAKAAGGRARGRDDE